MTLKNWHIELKGVLKPFCLPESVMPWQALTFGGTSYWEENNVLDIYFFMQKILFWDHVDVFSSRLAYNSLNKFVVAYRVFPTDAIASAICSFFGLNKSVTVFKKVSMDLVYKCRVAGRRHSSYFDIYTRRSPHTCLYSSCNLMNGRAYIYCSSVGKLTALTIHCDHLEECIYI